MMVNSTMSLGVLFEQILYNHQAIEKVRITSGIPTIGGDSVRRGPSINFPNAGFGAHHPLELTIMKCHSSFVCLSMIKHQFIIVNRSQRMSSISDDLINHFGQYLISTDNIYVEPCWTIIIIHFAAKSRAMYPPYQPLSVSALTITIINHCQPLSTILFRIFHWPLWLLSHITNH